MKSYPLFLVNLQHHRVVVIGSNAEAAHRIAGLEASGAGQIVLIAPRPCPELTPAIESERVIHLARVYQPGDLRHALLAITTEQDAELNAWVAGEARVRGVLLQAMDDPPHCSAYAPSVVRRGELTIAISTNGKSPALAVRLREQLEASLSDGVAPFLSLATRLRPMVRERLGRFEARREFWYQLVDSDVLPLLEQGQHHVAWRRALQLLEAA